MVAPIFKLEYSLATVTRKNIAKADVVDALKANSGATSFVDFTMVLPGFTVRWGEWLAPQSDGKWGYADSADGISMPVWQDPQLRYDHEGGLTVLQGKFTAWTNVINRVGLAVQARLVVATLPSDHSILPSGVGLGLLDDADEDDEHMVVAHVEKIETDLIKISNISAGFVANGGA